MTAIKELIICFFIFYFFWMLDPIFNTLGYYDQKRCVVDVEDALTMVISIDALHPSYLDRCPFLRKHAQKSFTGPLRSQFPSYTLPNHYSMVTGKSINEHGIVSNRFWDDKEERFFQLRPENTTDDPAWWSSENIWQRAGKHGKSSASLFWTSDTYNGHPLHTSLPYARNVSTRERVDQLLKWAGETDTKASPKYSLINGYFPVLDGVAHRHGVNSPQMDEALLEIDAEMKRLVKGVGNTVNLMIVGDHGMVDVVDGDPSFPGGRINLHELLPELDGLLAFIEYNSVSFLRPVKGKTQAVYSMLHDLSHPSADKQRPPFTLYWTSELPNDWAISQGDRIGPITLVADLGYYFVDPESTHFYRGLHGYDPLVPEMHSLLIASGPAFPQKRSFSEPVDNRCVYNAMCAMLKMPQRPDITLFSELLASGGEAEEANNGAWIFNNDNYDDDYVYVENIDGNRKESFRGVLRFFFKTLFRLPLFLEHNNHY